MPLESLFVKSDSCLLLLLLFLISLWLMLEFLIFMLFLLFLFLLLLLCHKNQFKRWLAVLIDQSDNQTVMEGMTATFFCKFESDLGVLVSWIRPSKQAIEQETTVFDPKDPMSYEILKDPESGEQVSGEYFTIKNAKLSDSGLYFCAGQTNSGMTPGFLHLKVRTS